MRVASQEVTERGGLQPRGRYSGNDVEKGADLQASATSSASDTVEAPALDLGSSALIGPAGQEIEDTLTESTATHPNQAHTQASEGFSKGSSATSRKTSFYWLFEC